MRKSKPKRIKILNTTFQVSPSEFLSNHHISKNFQMGTKIAESKYNEECLINLNTNKQENRKMYK